MFCEIKSSKDVLWNQVFKRCFVKSSLQKMFCEINSSKDVLWNQVFKWWFVKSSLQKMFCEIKSSKDVLWNQVFKRCLVKMKNLRKRLVELMRERESICKKFLKLLSGCIKTPRDAFKTPPRCLKTPPKSDSPKFSEGVPEDSLKSIGKGIWKVRKRLVELMKDHVQVWIWGRPGEPEFQTNLGENHADELENPNRKTLIPRFRRITARGINYLGTTNDFFFFFKNRLP